MFHRAIRRSILGVPFGDDMARHADELLGAAGSVHDTAAARIFNILVAVREPD